MRLNSSSRHSTGAVMPQEQELQYKQQRLEMVRDQLEARGIKDAAVLNAMAFIPRHRFVPMELQSKSYEDRALPIGRHESISQPYIVALMLEKLELKPDDKVLEIGTGSGYQAAVLSQIV